MRAKQGIFFTNEEKQELFEMIPEAEEKIDFLEKGLGPRERFQRRLTNEIERDRFFYELTGIKNEAKELDLDAVELKYELAKKKFAVLKASGKHSDAELDNMNYEEDDDNSDEFYDRLKVKTLEKEEAIYQDFGKQTLKKDAENEADAEMEMFQMRTEQIL